METVNDVREEISNLQDESFFENAIVDIDATVAETGGECKEGMGLSYRGIWGYAPSMISLANTREPLYLVNRPGNTPSCQEAARWIDRTIERLSGKVQHIELRGDTDYSLTYKFDEWSEKADFIFGYDAKPNVVAIAEGLPESAWAPLARRPKYEVKTEPRGRRRNVKEAIVKKEGYTNIRLVCEPVTGFLYRPTLRRKTYRMVVARKHLSVERGENVLFREMRYFFYITTYHGRPREEIVYGANARCDQENVFGQFHGGPGVMRMLLDNLYSNWAYMVIAATAWTLKAWCGLLVPDATESQRVVRMEFRRFVHTVVLIPCQLVRQSRRVVFRILSYNSWLPLLFQTYDVIRRLRLA